MQRGVLQALNPLSNRVTLTAIVPGAYPGERKMWLKSSPKIYRYISETVEDRWVLSLAADA